MKTWVLGKHLTADTARSITLPLFDAAESQRHADEGIALAAEHKASLVVKAREIAVATCKRKGTATMDDVVREMCVLGYDVHCLGNSAGSVFKDRRFKFTGHYTKSERIHAKANVLRVWSLR